MDRLLNRCIVTKGDHPCILLCWVAFRTNTCFLEKNKPPSNVNVMTNKCMYDVVMLSVGFIRTINNDNNVYGKINCNKDDSINRFWPCKRVTKYLLSGIKNIRNDKIRRSGCMWGLEIKCAILLLPNVIKTMQSKEVIKTNLIMLQNFWAI